MARRRRALQPPRPPLSFRICSSSRSRALFTLCWSGSVKNQICEAQSSSPPYGVSSARKPPPTFAFHTTTSPTSSFASDVCKPGVRGAPQLTRVLDLEFCQLSRLCSPYVSSITTVAGLPTPLTAPLSSSQPYQLNIAASLLRRDSSHELDKPNKAPKLPSLPSSFTAHFDVGWIGLLD
ncbi:hypothetical protein F2Q69_00057413 [Brassica cretica]|uniref:Uncharacterized protein n=1 Tax=Brassica cretica TaxID=69181 RepID=A0A8S9MZT1_BRACR|nr:hypothetical protein F2Q69_00057413 [Brassica cretica]